MKKTELKVSIHCQKCKKDVLKAVTKLNGINQVTVDEEKGTLTVVGEVDPALLTEALRKGGKYAELVSVGPPKPPEPKPSKPKPSEPKPSEPRSPPRNFPPPPWCIEYQLVPICHDPCDSGSCSIL